MESKFTYDSFVCVQKACFLDWEETDVVSHYISCVVNLNKLLFAHDHPNLPEHVKLIFGSKTITVKGSLSDLIEYEYKTGTKKLHKLKAIQNERA